MTLWRPDPTFYPSPKMAMMRWAWWTLNLDHPVTAGLWDNWICRIRVTSCIILAGTLAARACARTLRIRTWNGAT